MQPQLTWIIPAILILNVTGGFSHPTQTASPTNWTSYRSVITPAPVLWKPSNASNIHKITGLVYYNGEPLRIITHRPQPSDGCAYWLGLRSGIENVLCIHSMSAASRAYTRMYDTIPAGHLYKVTCNQSFTLVVPATDYLQTTLAGMSDAILLTKDLVVWKRSIDPQYKSLLSTHSVSTGYFFTSYTGDVNRGECFTLWDKNLSDMAHATNDAQSEIASEMSRALHNPCYGYIANCDRKQTECSLEETPSTTDGTQDEIVSTIQGRSLAKRLRRLQQIPKDAVQESGWRNKLAARSGSHHLVTSSKTKKDAATIRPDGSLEKDGFGVLAIPPLNDLYSFCSGEGLSRKCDIPSCIAVVDYVEIIHSNSVRQSDYNICTNYVTTSATQAQVTTSLLSTESSVKPQTVPLPMWERSLDWWYNPQKEWNWTTIVKNITMFENKVYVYIPEVWVGSLQYESAEHTRENPLPHIPGYEGPTPISYDFEVTKFKTNLVVEMKSEELSTLSWDEQSTKYVTRRMNFDDLAWPYNLAAQHNWNKLPYYDPDPPSIMTYGMFNPDLSFLSALDKALVEAPGLSGCRLEPDAFMSDPPRTMDPMTPPTTTEEANSDTESQRANWLPLLTHVPPDSQHIINMPQETGSLTFEQSNSTVNIPESHGNVGGTPNKISATPSLLSGELLHGPNGKQLFSEVDDPSKIIDDKPRDGAKRKQDDYSPSEGALDRDKLTTTKPDQSQQSQRNNNKDGDGSRVKGGTKSSVGLGSESRQEPGKTYKSDSRQDSDNTQDSPDGQHSRKKPKKNESIRIVFPYFGTGILAFFALLIVL